MGSRSVVFAHPPLLPPPNWKSLPPSLAGQLFAARQMPPFCQAPDWPFPPGMCAARAQIGGELGTSCAWSGSKALGHQLQLSDGPNRIKEVQSLILIFGQFLTVTNILNFFGGPFASRIKLRSNASAAISSTTALAGDVPKSGGGSSVCSVVGPTPASR